MKKMIYFVPSLFLLTGCATMFSKTADVIEFKSEPAGATVEIDGQEVCTTPCRHLVQRDTFRDRHLVVRKSGYRTHQGDLEKSLDEKSLFNFGFITTTMGGTSWGIDALTGAMFRFERNSYYFQLEQDGSAVDGEHERRRFVMQNFPQLRKDIAAGEGEWLGAYQQLRSESQLQPVSMSNRREILLRAENSLDFFIELERS